MISTRHYPVLGRTYRQSRQAVRRRQRAIDDGHRHDKACITNRVKEVSA